MKQLVILSGKGGTGKTTIAGAFIKLSKAKAYADCDVDAPNLHLTNAWSTEPEKADYYGLPKAFINPKICIACDQCRKHCRFGAISFDNHYKVDPYALVPAVDGELMLYADGEKVFSTARLNMGSGTSGMLVTEVKKRMQSRSEEAEMAIIDGSPGIGCQVIASLSGVDMVLVVAEPSVSGISDMERIIHTAANFGIKIAVCVNKYDTNIDLAKKIEHFCKEQGLHFVGRIPFDANAVRAMNDGKTIVDIDCIAGTSVRKIYQRTMKMLYEEGDS